MSKNYDVPELFCAALEYLDHAIGISYWNQHQEEFESPIGNTGASYDGGTFKLRAFDWSEPDEYEPNFEWRDVKVWWYKYLGRGTYAVFGIAIRDTDPNKDDLEKTSNALRNDIDCNANSANLVSLHVNSVDDLAVLVREAGL